MKPTLTRISALLLAPLAELHAAETPEPGTSSGLFLYLPTAPTVSLPTRRFR